MRKHRLKSWPAQYRAVCAGGKTAEFRKEDREIEIGDILVLLEYDSATETFSGQEREVEVTHLVRGPSFDIPEGYAVLSIKRVPII